jgi:hypothetical protein
MDTKQNRTNGIDAKQNHKWNGHKT